MSISNEKTVWCDSCGNFVQLAEGDHGGTDEGAREAAEEQGFHRFKVLEPWVVDLCGDCWVKLRWKPTHLAVLKNLHHEGHLTKDQYEKAVKEAEKEHAPEGE